MRQLPTMKPFYTLTMEIGNFYNLWTPSTGVFLKYFLTAIGRPSTQTFSGFISVQDI